MLRSLLDSDSGASSTTRDHCCSLILQGDSHLFHLQKRCDCYLDDLGSLLEVLDGPSLTKSSHRFAADSTAEVVETVAQQ